MSAASQRGEGKPLPLDGIRMFNRNKRALCIDLKSAMKKEDKK